MTAAKVSEVLLRNKGNEWTVAVAVSDLESASAVLKNMIGHGSIKAQVEVFDDGTGLFVRKGELDLGDSTATVIQNHSRTVQAKTGRLATMIVGALSALALCFSASEFFRSPEPIVPAQPAMAIATPVAPVVRPPVEAPVPAVRPVSASASAAAAETPVVAFGITGGQNIGGGCKLYYTMTNHSDELVSYAGFKGFAVDASGNIIGSASAVSVNIRAGGVAVDYFWFGNVRCGEIATMQSGSAGVDLVFEADPASKIPIVI